MTKQNRREFRQYLLQNYTNPSYTREGIAAAWGVSIKTLERHVRELGLQNIRTVKPRKSKYSFSPDKPRFEVPAGAIKTQNGFAVKVGTKTVHRMAG